MYNFKLYLSEAEFSLPFYSHDYNYTLKKTLFHIYIEASNQYDQAQKDSILGYPIKQDLPMQEISIQVFFKVPKAASTVKHEAYV